MTDGIVTMNVRILDMDRTRLFVHEICELVDEMRVMASPHVERLQHAIDRYMDGGDDEGGGVLDDQVTIEVEDFLPCPMCGFKLPAGTDPRVPPPDPRSWR